jgi:hypothetical protein
MNDRLSRPFTTQSAALAGGSANSELVVGRPSSASTPKCSDRLDCGSMSTSSVRRPAAARPAPRFTVVVVLPTPPFWFSSATMRGPLVRADMGREYRTPGA